MSIDGLAARIEAVESNYETCRFATLEWGRDVDTHGKLIDKLWQRVEALEAAQPKIRSGPESPLVERVADAIAAEATSAGIVNDRPARALLAQPEPEVPTDEELLRVAATAIAPYEISGITPGEYEPETECVVEAYGSELIAYARVVLARWGRPTPQPVAVSERLPGPEDCIFPTGECWWFDPHADGAWYVDTFQGNYTHWLPANALPTPEATNG